MAPTAPQEEQLLLRFIEQDPQRPGADEARIADSGVPVWALVGYYFAVGEHIDQVAADYEIPREAVMAAIAYYRQHRALIDARLAANAVAVA